MVPGKEYLIKHGSRSVSGRVTTLRYQIDVNTLHRSPSATLGLNEIGRCQLQLNQQIAYDGYRRNRSGGAFVIIDRLTNVTVGAGMILDRKSADDADADVWEQEANSDLQERRKPGHRRRAACSLRPAGGNGAADRPARGGQDADCRGRRAQAVRHGPGRGGHRRSEHAPWVVAGLGIRRHRSQRERPPRRRGGEDPQQRRPDYDCRVRRPA